MFLIVAQNRRSPTEVEELAYYCVAEGIVFQCPKLCTLLRAKMDDAAFGIDTLFNLLFDQYPEIHEKQMEDKYTIDLDKLFKWSPVKLK